MYNPHPGELNTPVDIYSTTNTINENGYPVETDTLVCHVWADVQDASNRYFRTADADAAETGLTFFIRWRNDIQLGMWVMWNGERQYIEQIGQLDFRHRYLQLTTKSVKGVK